MATAVPKSVDVNSFMDGLKVGRFHIWIVAVCVLLMIIDGYEMYVLGWVLPSVSEDFGVSRTALTPILVVQQIGMVLGAYFIAPLADKIGRPQILGVAFMFIAISCFVCIFAPTIPVFMACRFFAGLFASAVVPILLSIVSETAPKRVRATFSTILVTGSLGGALIGAGMQAFLLEPYGWRSAFWLGALMPVAMLPVIWFLLPDSVRHIMAKNPADPRIPVLAKRLQGAGAEEVTLVPAATPAAIGGKPETARGSFMRGLFGEGRALRTIFLWLAFMSSFTYISAGNWKTTIFKDVVGLDWQQVALATALGTGFGILGNICVGMSIDRWGFRRVLPTSFFIAAVTIILMGFSVHSLGLFFTFLIIMNIFQHGGQAGIAALASSLYPASQTATGVGWAYGTGRVASIFAPMLGALALASAPGAVALFALYAIPLTSAGIFALLATSTSREQPKAAMPAHA